MNCCARKDASLTVHAVWVLLVAVAVGPPGIPSPYSKKTNPQDLALAPPFRVSHNLPGAVLQSTKTTDTSDSPFPLPHITDEVTVSYKCEIPRDHQIAWRFFAKGQGIPGAVSSELCHHRGEEAGGQELSSTGSPLAPANLQWHCGMNLNHTRWPAV